jgi:hypothetical protein
MIPGGLMAFWIMFLVLCFSPMLIVTLKYKNKN